MTRPTEAGETGASPSEDGAKRPVEADLSRVRTVPIGRRPNKVSASEFAAPPTADLSFHSFLDSLPDVLAARDLRRVAGAIADAAARERAVVVMLGGYVVKTGLAPVPNVC